MIKSNPRSEVEFLVNLQRLLDEGDFSATYKFALLLALADLCVERVDTTETPTRISVKDIAEKFIQYFWQQVIPFPVPAEESTSRLLLHNRGKQAAIARLVSQARLHSGGSLARARADQARWTQLLTEVAGVIRQQPLWKLQVMGGEINDFLYAHRQTGPTIELRREVAAHLRKFHGIVQQLVQGAWVNWLRSYRKNREVLGDTADLSTFLFGPSRESLGAVRPILAEHQKNLCFYCGHHIRSKGDIDHFIPWVRYPSNLGHNLVLTHSSCNNLKRDFLAAPRFLRRWVERNGATKSQFETDLISAGFEHHLRTSNMIASWAYTQGEQSGAMTWVGADRFERLGSEWRSILQV